VAWLEDCFSAEIPKSNQTGLPMKETNEFFFVFYAVFFVAGMTAIVKALCILSTRLGL